jgi:hypothetical protein
MSPRSRRARREGVKRKSSRRPRGPRREKERRWWRPRGRRRQRPRPRPRRRRQRTRRPGCRSGRGRTAGGACAGKYFGKFLRDLVARAGEWAELFPHLEVAGLNFFGTGEGGPGRAGDSRSEFFWCLIPGKRTSGDSRKSFRRSSADSGFSKFPAGFSKTAGIRILPGANHRNPRWTSADGVPGGPRIARDLNAIKVRRRETLVFRGRGTKIQIFGEPCRAKIRGKKISGGRPRHPTPIL